jgi:hypothetical protein
VNEGGGEPFVRKVTNMPLDRGDPFRYKTDRSVCS